jgi:class 3 adenylate cyclase
MLDTVERRVVAQRSQEWRGEAFDGLVAILVTDLENFTGTVEQLGDAPARELLSQHDELVRRLVSGRGGREVAHTGDGVIAVFRSVSAALETSRALQRSLAGSGRQGTLESLRTRAGIHAGEPLPTTGRLIGTSLNATVRMCGAARPGTILVSDLVRQLASGTKFQFKARGSLALKGLSFTIKVHELLP